MQGLMMDNYQLTIGSLVRRAALLFPRREIVSRRPDKSIHRTTFALVEERARRLSAALRALGLQRGDRIATLAWNHADHLAAYYGIPSGGYVTHTLNLRLHPDDLAFIATHGGDRAIIVDEVLLPLFEKFRERTNIEHVIVMRSSEAPLPSYAMDFETLLATAHLDGTEFPDLDERSAAGMCYTSGTTGRPKGVLYSHRSSCLHTLAECLPNSLGLTERDTVLAIVPMFHANAWGLPYASAMMGARQIMPGPHLDAGSLLELIQQERVTMIAGVPTIMLGLLAALDANPTAYDVSSVRMAVIGGSAVPESLIRAFSTRYGIEVLQGWGLTETSPLASVGSVPPEMDGADADTLFRYRARQGRVAPFIEVRARNEDESLAPWDGVAMGELEVRGPWVVSEYYNSVDGASRFTADGWFKTGDIASIHPDGGIEIRDRSKDVIKSGGEWISSVALENALMGHPAVAEATVIAVAEVRWQERPLAVVVLKPGATVTHETLIAFLEPQFPKWWMPDATEFVEVIPKTSAGKFLKMALREQFAGRLLGG